MHTFCETSNGNNNLLLFLYTQVMINFKPVKRLSSFRRESFLIQNDQVRSLFVLILLVNVCRNRIVTGIVEALY